MNPTTGHRIFKLPFASVYPLYIEKVEKKGRTKDELDEVGTGTHTRFVVDKARTFERLKAKATRFAQLRDGRR